MPVVTSATLLQSPRRHLWFAGGWLLIAGGWAVILQTTPIHQATVTVAEQEADSQQYELQWQKLEPLPDSVGLAGAFAGASPAGLLVAGGANFPDQLPWDGGAKVWHARVWLLEQPTGAWSDVGELSQPLAYGISAFISNGLVCVGGSDRQRHYARVFVLELSGQRVLEKPLADLPVPLANACGGVIGQTLYVCGGTEAPDSARPLAKLWSLDLAAQQATWRELPECPGGPRMLATAAVTDDTLYLFGGADLELGPDGSTQRIYRRDAWAYQPQRGWTQLADLPTPLVAAPSPAPVTRSGKILLLGGDTGEWAGFQPPAEHPGFSRRIWAFAPETNQWEEVGTLPAARVTVPLVPWEGGWVLCSGESRPGVRSPEIWSLREQAVR